MAEKICSVADLAPGEVKGFQVADRSGKLVDIALVHSESGKWYALADKCSHGRIKLSTGFVEGECLECEWHGSRFSLESGQPLNPPASRPVATYSLEIIDQAVYVNLDN